MKIVLTGSLGHISKPLAIALTGKGHSVTIISSDPAKQKEIEALGAKAAIGSVEDPEFLIQAFNAAEAVYCMLPPNNTEPDRRVYYSRVAKNYVQAIKNTNIKRVVHLSSFGADLDKGTGIILGAHDAETIFNQLTDVHLTHMRPTYFYYNLNNFLKIIRHQNIIKANYGGDQKFPLVAPEDIATAVAEELQNLNSTTNLRYVSSDERSGHEIARILGEAIGKPDLKWEVISNEEVQKNMESFGMPSMLAAGYVEMFDSMHKGEMAKDFYKHPLLIPGKTKLEDFAKEFAILYQQG